MWILVLFAVYNVNTAQVRPKPYSEFTSRAACMKIKKEIGQKHAWMAAACLKAGE